MYMSKEQVDRFLDKAIDICDTHVWYAQCNLDKLIDLPNMHDALLVSVSIITQCSTCQC